jgi:outer membrane murein-binding lipoprotein Lpp
VKCNDCSKFVCLDCRQAHLQDAFNQISSSVSQLRRSLPKLSEKVGAYEQRVNAVRTNDEQVRREIALAIASLIDQLKHREKALFTEAEVYMQSQLRL